MTRCLLVIGFLAGTALAQPALDPAPQPEVTADEAKPWAMGVSAEQQATALELFQQGNTEYQELRYAQALAKYREALKYWDHPSIRFNIAVCLINLEQPLEAKENLTLALKFGAAALGADMFRQALTYQKLLEAQLAHVKISCKEPNAVIVVDGKQRFIAPGSVELDLIPGDHVVLATKRGFLTASEKLDLRPGKQFAVDVRLIALTSTTTTTRRWAPWKPWTVVGGGALVMGVGALTYAFASSNISAFDSAVMRDCPTGCDPARTRELGVKSMLDSGKAEAVVAFTLFGVGAAAVAAGVVAVVLNAPHTHVLGEVEPHVMATPQGGSVSMGWRF